uniref:GntR family transcriptional regulator n=1 Tax=Haemonchus contortus TaxID=6289 RepID=A0A7I5EE49_HAECO
MRLEHAVAFRQVSQTIIDQLVRGEYTATENAAPPTLEVSMPGALLPRIRSQFFVLHQVVNKGLSQGAVLEAEDFVIPGPDRRELHLVVLDHYATNVASST